MRQILIALFCEGLIPNVLILAALALACYGLGYYRGSAENRHMRRFAKQWANSMPPTRNWFNLTPDLGERLDQLDEEADDGL